MSNFKTFHVDGCPLCKIFTELDIKTKLYYPEKKNISEEDDFVIVECLSCKEPMVIVTDHATEIGREQWGRILYRCKKLFGDGVRLRTKRRTIRDHWHAHVSGITRDTNKLPDLGK